MKKVMAIALVLLLTAALFACGPAGPTASPTTSPATASPTTAAPTTGAPATGASPGAGAAEIGFFDPTIDYSKQPRYKVVYMYYGTSFLYDMFSDAFAKWAERMNVDYSDYSQQDADAFVTAIQTYADQGVQGFLLDPDSTVYPRIADLMGELKLPWMSCMSPAFDVDTGKQLHPSVGFNNVEFGYDMFQWCIDYAKKNWPDATAENTGGMFVGYSTNPLLEQRHEGSRDAWLKNGYPESSYFFLDGVTGQMDAQTGYNLASATMAANPKYKYWVGCGFFDEYSVGIARAAESAGKGEQTICSTAGGSSLIAQWDTGEDSSWKSAIYTDQRLYAEPIFNALYAMMNGKATAETLWPKWVNKAAGETYASLKLPSVVITKDMYQDYLEFVDKYTGIELYSYTVANPKTYPVTQDPPASYQA